MKVVSVSAVVRAATLAVATLGAAFGAGAIGAAAPLPRPAHVVIVIDENKAFGQVIDNAHAPYLNGVAKRGTIFTDAHGITHPSLPNYLALFAGLTNTNGDGCPAVGFSRNAPNLASELLAAHLTFGAYSESLPQAGFTGCSAGELYARKHAPWVEFANVPQAFHRPFAALPSYDRLPTVTFIVPNLTNDMHDAPVPVGDAWARTVLAPLFRWADAHDTLVIVTWDEGYDDANSTPTFFYGPMVRAGRSAERIDHYRVLRTVEDMYGLTPSGHAAQARPIANVWR